MDNKTVFFRLPQVMRISGLSRSGIYSAIRAGTFPRQVNIGARAVGWSSADIQAWILSRMARADGDASCNARSEVRRG
ncbi:helix-turn-helix transcriptional regulator [Achromobacter insuavis]|uniref:helix-turn-helix transcriptional regulator n=1 Tax=Achromobacter insuavis TaxID=1287735 RepID=UPI003B9BB0DA